MVFTTQASGEDVEQERTRRSVVTPRQKKTCVVSIANKRLFSILSESIIKAQSEISEEERECTAQQSTF